MDISFANTKYRQLFEDKACISDLDLDVIYNYRKKINFLYAVNNKNDIINFKSMGLCPYDENSQFYSINLKINWLLVLSFQSDTNITILEIIQKY